MKIGDLASCAAFVLFMFDDGSGFYIRTSFNPKICPAKDDHLYDILSGKFIPRRLLDGCTYEVLENEPINYLEESEFWKSLM